MSRIRRLSQVISEEGRRALASQQAARIRDAAFTVVDQANLNASTSRKITKKAAFTVVLRSLQASRNLPFSLREHMALKELSQYITLAQSDKSNSLTLSHTDLLPISHPRSTRNHSMTASALLEARARWIADDPRVIDGYAKTIIASALTSKYDSVEHIYYNSILSNLPQGTVPSDIILAAGSSLSGGNSSAERSLRARLQRRDREGKFAFMGGGLSALVRRKNGKVFNLVGRPIIDGPNGDDVQMQLPDGKIVNIPASKGMFVKAIINPTPDGFSKDPAKTATTGNIINEEDLVFVDAPKGWKKTGDNTWESEDGKYTVSKSNDQYEVKDTKSGKTVSSKNSDWEDALDSIAEKEDGKKATLPSEPKKNNNAPVNTEKKVAPGEFEFNYPDGAIKMKIDESYDPEGRVDEVSPDFTDDPAELAQMFDPRDLVQALQQGVLPENEGDNAIGYGVLRFNGGDEYVPVQAIYNALGEAGEDAPLELARIYDNGLGSNDNEDALKDNRKGVARLDQAKPDVAESFERTAQLSPDEVPATEEPKFSEAEMDQVPLPPTLEGLSDGEMKQFMESKDHTPYLPKNDSIDMPEGYNTLSPEPFQSWREVTADTPDAVLPEGFSDNPVFLAQSIQKDKLEAELRRSLEPTSETPGYANISLQDEDGEEFIANVPGEAVRDALQLQGVDTNELIKSIADEGFAGQKDESIAELPLDLPAEPKPMNAYERLMAENKAAADAVTERRAKLDKDAQDRVDEQGRSIPEGWGIERKNKLFFGGLDRPENHFNVYGNNNFEASVGPDGKITIKDRNGLVSDKTYDTWEELQADFPAQQAEYSSLARERVREIAKNYGYSDEQIAAFDSMSQGEIADFFANPDNQTDAHKSALDDLRTSFAVDLPRKEQKDNWNAIAKNEKILAQAGDTDSPARTDDILKKVKELSDGEKAVIANNDFVEANAGSLQPIAAEDVQVGDFIWNAFHGRYEKVLSNKYAGVMNRMEMEVFNVKNGNKEIRYFEMDSPLRNVRRPGVEDQAEPIPSAKAAPRGGKRNVIKRKAPSERIVAKEGRQMGGNFDKEGFYKDRNGAALVPGDVVLHKDPLKGGKWQRGVVKLRIGAQVEEGKKAGAVGRNGVAYLDYLIVQWEGEDDEYAIKQGGRQVKAKNLIKQDENIDGIVLPDFRGGRAVPNAPANAPAKPAPEQGRLLNTPEAAPAAPIAPEMPRPVYNAQVEDKKGNKFKISVVKINDMFEAAVFNEDGKLNAVIAKNFAFNEVQGVIGRFIGDVAEANDGEKVLRVYGELPDPVEQLAFTGETVDVPELPAVKAIDLKEAKSRAKSLAAKIQDRDIPADDRKDIPGNEQVRMKKYIQDYLAPEGVDRRQNGKFNENLRVAYRYAVRLGWFEEAQQIAALQKRVDKLPLRDGGEDFNNKIADLREMHPQLFGMELELAKKLDYNGRRKVDSLMNALNDMIVNPDVYNPNFRGAVIRGRGDIDAILASIDLPNLTPADAEVVDKMKEIKKRFDALGDLPKLPSREKGNDDMQNNLANIARGFEGLSIDDLRNGVGDWKFERSLTAGINKVYLLRNALTGERIVVKYDNDGNRGNFKGNGIKAEEMVAALYRDLGFAQPAFVVVNPENPTPEVGGIGIMQYADAGFFGLVNIDTHNNAGIYNIDNVADEHKAELLDFIVANAIIGNSDRHGGNFMWGVDPVTGKARLIPIDNGLAMFNAGFGKPEESPNDPLHVNPLKVIQGDYGNRNQVGKFGKRWVQEIGEDAARSQVVEFAQRMRDRAEKIKFVDERASEYLMARADFIINDPKKFIDTVLRFW